MCEKKHDIKPEYIISKLKHPARPRQNFDFPQNQNKDRKLIWVQKCWNGSCQRKIGLDHLENEPGVKTVIPVSWVVRHHKLFHTWFGPSLKNYCANTGAKQNCTPWLDPVQTSKTGWREARALLIGTTGVYSEMNSLKLSSYSNQNVCISQLGWLDSQPPMLQWPLP